MRNQVLKSEEEFPTSLRLPGHLERAGHGPVMGMASEEAFARTLCLERKRAERSHKLLLLMLLDARELFRDGPAAGPLSKIVSALSSSLRETDVFGWYQKGSIFGILFTEIGEGEKSEIAKTFLTRMSAALGRCLEMEQFTKIRISLNFFPENWDAGDPGSKINTALYPDRFRHGNGKGMAQLLKRTIDVVGSAAGLVILSPVLLAISALIKLTSEGTVLFRQERVGQFGTSFEFLKFRSMKAANDPTIHRKFVQEFISKGAQGTRQGSKEVRAYKLKVDPRITGLGTFLRKTSLDEVPQLWNVLKGDMSLVGPRPPIPYELECYDVWHRRRLHEAKPGITGLWQVNGRSRTTFDEMVRLDLKYARTWSIWLDAKILLKTPLAVFSGEGAY